MSKKKTQLTPGEVEAFLQKQLAFEIANLQQLVEGEESQAFSYIHRQKEYVIRINKRICGFQKDSYAYSHFHSERIPIPKVIQIGNIDELHAFCLAEKMSGITLQDVDDQTLKHLLQPTFEVWLALSDSDISQTTGFGDFDALGQGTYGTWQLYLLSILNPQIYDWNRFLSASNQEIFEEIRIILTTLVPYCPEERSLIHGDFGANNILTHGQRITSVLDWENAKYGDPLYDVATAFFWSPWLDCMAAQAVYYELHLSTLPNFQERLVCYQLHIGLAEIYDSLLHKNWKMAAWALGRCVDIMRAF